MGEILGAIFRIIIELIVQIILYIVTEILAELLVMPIRHYFFVRTRWFSPLYITLAVFVGIQLYRSLQRVENPSANLYDFAATVLILIIAPLLHVRMQALFSTLKQPTTSTMIPDEKPKR
jgi:carbon starvation protein CstA